MSNLDTALSLARVGWFVAPWNDAEGRGHVRWKEGASTDLTTVKKWWQRWPDARIGIHMGMSGLLVVDRDRKDERDGFASLKAAGLPLPRTFNYRSRGGKGRHDFYAAPDDADLTVAVDLNGMRGVDIRAGVGLAIYNGPKLTEAPTLAPAPKWALVHRKENDYEALVSLDEWLDDERQPDPTFRSLHFAKAVPLRGASNGDLLPLLTPIVSSLKLRLGRRRTYEVARERYTRHYPDAGPAFDQAFTKAIARVEHDWEEQEQKKVSKVSSAEVPDIEDNEEETPTPKKGNDLLLQEFPELDWIVPNVIPDGCHLLIAAPKIGKSLLTLGFGIACAKGGKALGVVQVRKRPVLLLDLESGERRLQSRLKNLGVRALPDSFEYHTDPDTALAVMQVFLAKHRGKSPLVILDTLSGVMGSRPRDMTQFQHEKATLQPLQKLCADDPGTSILVVHHNRKAKEGDSVDASSGTHGLTAAVDGIIALNRPSRREPEATLICELRDVEGDEYAIILDTEGWVLDGANLEQSRLNAMERHNKEKLAKQGDLGTEVIELLRLHGPLTPAEVFDWYRRDPKATAQEQSVRNALSRLHRRGLVSKAENGRYAMGTTPELPELRVAENTTDSHKVSWGVREATRNSPNSGVGSKRRATAAKARGRS